MHGRPLMGAGMFDYESPKKKSPTDWSGTIIGVMLLPVFFVFVLLGKAEMGFNLMLVLGLVMIAVKLEDINVASKIIWSGVS